VLTCPICHSTKFETALTCKDFTVSGELFLIKECTKCHLLVTSPAPEIQDLSRYYQSDQYISHTSKATSLVNAIYLQARSFTLNWKEGLITKSCRSIATRTMLDYGCGTGEFLQRCKSTGWSIHGVEPAEQIIASSIEDIPNDGFQIITLWHVLEHIPDLNSILSKLYEKLHPDGRLLIAVPNPSSWDSNHYKDFWAAYDVPRHLWHFKPQNLESLLRVYGFTLERRIPMKLDAYYVSLLSEKYRKNGNTTLLGILKAIINGIRSNLSAKKTGEYSSIIYIAKK
jgi:SAM-dependent methyltransferase